MMPSDEEHRLHRYPAYVRESPYLEFAIAEGAIMAWPYNRMWLPSSYGRDRRVEYEALLERVTLWDVGCERALELTGADAVAFARDLRVGRRRSRFDVTALCAGGELRVIFVAEPRAGKKNRARWRREVTRLNVHAAVGGARRQRARSLDRLPSLRKATDTARLAALRQVRLLSELGARELKRVAAAMTEHSFPAGSQLTTEGETGVGFYVIAEGRASVSVRGVEVARLGPGDHFGEIALVAETPRMATVQATSDLRCYRMVSWEFRKLIEQSGSISWQVLRSTAKLLDEERRADAVKRREPAPDGVLDRDSVTGPA